MVVGSATCVNCTDLSSVCANLSYLFLLLLHYIFISLGNDENHKNVKPLVPSAIISFCKVKWMK